MDQKTARLLFDYDASQGALINRPTRNKHTSRIGKAAGCIRKNGSRSIFADGKRQYASRIVWTWHHGTIPPGYVIDHIDGDPTNDRIENLRVATRMNNAQNSRKWEKKLSPKGVSFHKGRQLWVARISMNYRTMSLGYHPTEAIAHAAYMTAARKLFGEFARAE